MNKPETGHEKALDHPTTPAEGLAELIEEHRAEAISHDLTHQALLAEPHPPDHDARHPDPLRPDHHDKPGPHPPHRDLL